MSDIQAGLHWLVFCLAAMAVLMAVQLFSAKLFLLTEICLGALQPFFLLDYPASRPGWSIPENFLKSDKGMRTRVPMRRALSCFLATR
jgi:hypothetical protein